MEKKRKKDTSKKQLGNADILFKGLKSTRYDSNATSSDLKRLKLYRGIVPGLKV